MADIIFEEIVITGDLSPDDIVYTSNVQTYNDVARENSRNKANYERGYANQAINMNSGQVVPEERRQLLVPAEAVGVSGPVDSDGYIQRVMQGVPVVPQKELPFYAAGPKPVLAPNVTDILGPTANDPAHWRVGPKDTQPFGFETDYTNADGSVVRLVKINWAGFGAKYELVRKVS